LQVRVLSPLLVPVSGYETGKHAGVNIAELQVVLEGVPLPAGKSELVEYARREDQHAARLLESLPDRVYRSLDDVGEALAPVQPQQDEHGALPREQSDAPPGGHDYLDPTPEPGAVRRDAPPSNPPEKTLEQQTKTQKEQQQRQEDELPS
jgi:uncharacterized protein DUF2795